jgi:hypothetical protein
MLLPGKGSPRFVACAYDGKAIMAFRYVSEEYDKKSNWKRAGEKWQEM